MSIGAPHGSNPHEPEGLGPSVLRLPELRRGRNLSKPAANDNRSDWRSTLARKFVRPLLRLMAQFLRLVAMCWTQRR